MHEQPQIARCASIARNPAFYFYIRSHYLGIQPKKIDIKVEISDHDCTKVSPPNPHPGS